MKKILTTLLSVSLLLGASGVFADEVHEVKITADKMQFLYDVKEFTVKPGQKVKITLVNPEGSVQPHNLIIVKPEKMMVVGMAATTSAGDPKFLTEMEAVPESEDVLFHTKLLQPGEEDVLEFTAPEEPGDYPYLCTYPGHFAIMNGVMKVVK